MHTSSCHHRVPVGLFLLIFLVPSAAITAQVVQPTVGLSKVITTFLADSGARIHSLPWSTGNGMPIRWETTEPVTTTDAWLVKQGVTHTLTGTFVGTLGDSASLEFSITLTGVVAGIVGMSVTADSMLVTKPDGGSYFVNREMVEHALINEGLGFTPLKCKRETEGASFGNLVDIVKAPGKTASGFWWAWDSPMQQPRLTLSILYRRADINQVACREG